MQHNQTDDDFLTSHGNSMYQNVGNVPFGQAFMPLNLEISPLNKYHMNDNSGRKGSILTATDDYVEKR